VTAWTEHVLLGGVQGALRGWLRRLGLAR